MADDQANTIEFVLSEITTSIDKQMSWVDSIDRKAIALLTLGSALITILPAIAARVTETDGSWRLASLALRGQFMWWRCTVYGMPTSLGPGVSCLIRRS